jgi:hypothetical protein
MTLSQSASDALGKGEEGDKRLRTLPREGHIGLKIAFVTIVALE